MLRSAAACRSVSMSRSSNRRSSAFTGGRARLISAMLSEISHCRGGSMLALGGAGRGGLAPSATGSSRSRMGHLPAGQGREDFLHQASGRIRAQLHRDALASAFRFIDEIDPERMIQGRMEGMIVIHIGAIDPHPAVRAFGAAKKLRFLDDTATRSQ